MHECPQCWQVCYCDLDDSNDCRYDGECFHQCEPEERGEYEIGDDDPDFCDHAAGVTCANCCDAGSGTGGTTP